MKLRPALATIAAIAIATGGATAQVRHHSSAPSAPIIGNHSTANLKAQDALLPLPLPTLSLPPLPGPDGLPTCC